MKSKRRRDQANEASRSKHITPAPSRRLNGPALRITHKTLKLLQISEFQHGRLSLIYHPFPFSPVFYHRMLFFLATYWPLLEIASRRIVLVSNWRRECCWWSRGGSNSWPPHCERGALPTELLPHAEENTVSSFEFQVRLLPLLRSQVEGLDHSGVGYPRCIVYFFH